MTLSPRFDTYRAAMVPSVIPLAKAAEPEMPPVVYTLLGVPYTVVPDRRHGFLFKAARRKPAPGQMSFFDAPKPSKAPGTGGRKKMQEGATRMKNGQQQVLKNSRWRNVEPKGKTTPKPGLSILSDDTGTTLKPKARKGKAWGAEAPANAPAAVGGAAMGTTSLRPKAKVTLPTPSVLGDEDIFERDELDGYAAGRLQSAREGLKQALDPTHWASEVSRLQQQLDDHKRHVADKGTRKGSLSARDEKKLKDDLKTAKTKLDNLKEFASNPSPTKQSLTVPAHTHFDARQVAEFGGPDKVVSAYQLAHAKLQEHFGMDTSQELQQMGDIAAGNEDIFEDDAPVEAIVNRPDFDVTGDPAKLPDGTVFWEDATPEQRNWMERVGQDYMTPFRATKSEVLETFPQLATTAKLARSQGIKGDSDLEVAARYMFKDRVGDGESNLLPIHWEDEDDAPAALSTLKPKGKSKKSTSPQYKLGPDDAGLGGTNAPQLEPSLGDMPEKSDGHIGFDHETGHEYIQTRSGDVSRASISDPIMPDGRRFARFESTAAGWASHPVKKKLDGETEPTLGDMLSEQKAIAGESSTIHAERMSKLSQLANSADGLPPGVAMSRTLKPLPEGSFRDFPPSDSRTQPRTVDSGTPAYLSAIR